MIFALLFFASFVVGLVGYLVTERWWLGGVLCSVVLILFALISLSSSSMQGVAFYFGVPIVFLGSLFGAYIVQLRRSPDIDEGADSTESVRSEQAERDVSDSLK